MRCEDDLLTFDASCGIGLFLAGVSAVVFLDIFRALLVEASSSLSVVLDRLSLICRAVDHVGFGGVIPRSLAIGAVCIQDLPSSIHISLA